MALVRRLVELGRAARAESKVRTRQPLARALVAAAGFAELPDELRREVCDELNVGCWTPWAPPESWSTCRPRATSAHWVGGSARTRREWPPRSLPQTARRWRRPLRDAGVASVTVDGLGEVEVGPDEVIVTESPRTGWAVASDRGETVALDLELTPELVRAGLVREAIRLVQEARKASGFEVSDRIRLAWRADGDLAEALRADGGLLADEVLAVEVTEGLEALPDAPDQVSPELGLTFRLAAGLTCEAPPSPSDLEASPGSWAPRRLKIQTAKRDLETLPGVLALLDVDQIRVRWG